MTEVEKKITEKVNGPLLEFLGAENVERMKKQITDAIVEQVISDLRESYDYIISPNDIADEIYKDIVKSAKEKIRPKLEDALYKKMMEALGLEV